MKWITLACCLVACHHEDHQPATVTELFAGTKAPSLTGPILGGIHWTDDFAKVEAAVRTHDTPTLHYGTVGDMVGRLEVIHIRTTSDPRAELAALWGKPAATAQHGDALRPAGADIWYGDHVKAMATAEGVELIHLVPLAEELGAPNAGLFGFERGHPLVGSTPEEIEKTYKDELQKGNGGGRPMMLQLPDDELGSFQVALYDDNGKIVALQFYVEMQDKVSKARAQTVLKRFGKTELADDAKGFSWHGYTVDLLTSDVPDRMWSVKVSAQ